MRILRLIFLLVLGGCSGSFLNPYESEKSCPYIDNGHCMSVTRALEYSKGKNTEIGSASESELLMTAVKERSIRPRVGVPGLHFGKSKMSKLEIHYKRFAIPGDDVKRQLLKNQAQEMNNLIKKPGTPILTPAKVVRVLLLPQAENSGEIITMERFMYVMIKRPEFIFKNPYL